MIKIIALVALGVLCVVLPVGPSQAAGAWLDDAEQINQWLFIATDDIPDDPEDPDAGLVTIFGDNGEAGADQEVLSTSNAGLDSQRIGGDTRSSGFSSGSAPNLRDVFSEARWENTDPDHNGDTVGTPDLLKASDGSTDVADPLFEGIDYSGNMALLGENAQYDLSGWDVNADRGIVCTQSSSSCDADKELNSYFSPDDNPSDDPADDTGVELEDGAGVSTFSTSERDALIGELEDLRDFIVSLEADAVITNEDGFVNYYNGDKGTLVIDLDDIDSSTVDGSVAVIDNSGTAGGTGGNDDGFAVIDIDIDGADFNINNSDLILYSELDTFVIFRMADGGAFIFTNSSIMLGGSGEVIDTLGAMFFIDAYRKDTSYGLSNVVLGGVALLDMQDFNPDRTQLLYSGELSQYNVSLEKTPGISIDNAQGCTFMVAPSIDIGQNARWNRCTVGASGQQVPVPGALPLVLIGLFAMAGLRRRGVA